MSRDILLDCGTSYAKIYDLQSEKYEVIPTRHFKKKAGQYQVKMSTGYNFPRNNSRYVNELIALAEGGLCLIKEPSFTLLDCGARDLKYVKVQNRTVAAMDWNTECGAFAGQVIELLQSYLHISASEIPQDAKRMPVVCAVLGMTAMFDRISQGQSYEEAFASFLKGIAHNCYQLVNKPRKLYLSGGLCENLAFVQAFDCQLIPLGRFVLLEGLKTRYNSSRK
jgi:activator of 2-hydroxyglutaryl-CoA dehydratase